MGCWSVFTLANTFPICFPQFPYPRLRTVGIETFIHTKHKSQKKVERQVAEGSGVSIKTLILMGHNPETVYLAACVAFTSLTWVWQTHDVMPATFTAIGMERIIVQGFFFTSLLHCSFSYAFDPDRITLLEQGKSNSGLRSWPGHLNSPINSFFGGLDDFYFLRKE